jgi:hypothetical protein
MPDNVNPIPVNVQGQLLAVLLSGTDETGLTWALSNINNRKIDKDKAIVCASNLLLYRPKEFWTQCAPLLSSEIAFCKEVFMMAADMSFMFGEIRRLEEDLLAELFIWITRNFPAPKVAPSSGFRAIGSEERVRDFCSEIPSILSARQSTRSIQALEKIITAFPDMQGVQMLLDSTKQQVAIRLWTPLSPEMLTRLLENNKTRIVQNRDQLLEVVMQLLSEYQAEVRANSALLFALWNEGAPQAQRKEYSPKDEKSLSQQVAHRLRGQVPGVVVNCEVEVRVREEPDINVDATIPLSGGGTEQTSVYIEVKGLWHQYVTSCMKSQLIEKYLNESSCTRGVYFVGFYNCSAWTNTDKNKARCLKHGDLASVRQYFESQAADLSNERVLVHAFVLDASLPLHITGQNDNADAAARDKSETKPEPKSKRTRVKPQTSE